LSLLEMKKDRSVLVSVYILRLLFSFCFFDRVKTQNKEEIISTLQIKNTSPLF
jgi:hypothetical protein